MLRGGLSVLNFLKGTVAAGTLMAGLVLVPSQGQAQELQLVDIAYNGTGCPSDSAEVTIDNVSHTFSILFNQYVVYQPGPVTERRKNCALRILFNVPRGWQFSIADIRYKGFADLPSGVGGMQSATYEFPLFSPQYTSRTVLRGPYGPGYPPNYDGSYQRTDTIPLYTNVWSPCGAQYPLAIDTQTLLFGNQSLPATMTTDTVDGKVTQIYHWTWRTCTANDANYDSINDTDGE
jgi:hypothetical protein